MARIGYSVLVDTDNIAQKVPFIYLICSKKFKTLYVGETFNTYGGIGRLSQHIGRTDYSTFRKRICETFSFDDVEIGEVLFLAIPYCDKKSFTIKSNDYRSAVEYITQYALNNWVIENNINMLVISRVRANGYCRLKYIKEEAEAMFRVMSSWLMTAL